MGKIIEHNLHQCSLWNWN